MSAGNYNIKHLLSAIVNLFFTIPDSHNKKFTGTFIIWSNETKAFDLCLICKDIN